MTEWEKITPEDGNIGGSHSLAIEVYGWKGQQYPRLTISVMPDPLYKGDGVRIGANHKPGPKDFWSSWPIPRELIQNTIDLMTKFKAESNTGATCPE